MVLSDFWVRQELWFNCVIKRVQQRFYMVKIIRGSFIWTDIIRYDSDCSILISTESREIYRRKITKGGKNYFNRMRCFETNPYIYKNEFYIMRIVSVFYMSSNEYHYELLAKNILVNSLAIFPYGTEFMIIKVGQVRCENRKLHKFILLVFSQILLKLYSHLLYFLLSWFCYRSNYGLV